jgi:outer membrane protein
VPVEQNAADALRSEIGADGTVLTQTVPASFPALNPQLVDPIAVRALALKLRPEVLSARLTADAAIRSARAGGFPAITVAGGDLTGTDSGVPINAPTVNASLTLPLSRAAHDKVAISVAKAAEARSKAIAVERQITLDAAATARTLGAAQRAAAAMSRARQSAAAELNATEIGYRGGASSSLELTNALSTYVQAVVDELSAIYDFEKARAQLDIEVGR